MKLKRSQRQGAWRSGTTRRSSLLLEEAFGRAALLDGDRQEVGGHVRHQDLFHVAETRPPRHLVEVVVQPGRWGPVHKVRLFHGGRRSRRRRRGVVLEVSGSQVTGADLSPVSVWVGSVEMFVEAPAATAMALRVVVVVVMVVFIAVTEVLRVSVTHADLTRLLPTLDLGEFMRSRAGLVLRPPLEQLGVTKAGLGPPFFGRVDEANGAVLLKWRQADAFAAVDGARGEDGRNHGSQALSGSRGDDRLRSREVDPSDLLAPEVIGPGFVFGMRL